MISGPRRRAALGLCAAALLAAAALVARTGFAGAYGSGPFSFPHQPHVSAETVTAALAEAAAVDRTGKRPGGGGKVDAECRVCHDFTKPGDAHLASCAQCHVGPQHLEQQVAPAVPAPATAFPHAAHLKDTSVTCFSCHRVEKEMGWIEFTIPEGGLGAAGANGRPGGKHGDWTCTDCHRLHEPKGGLVKQDEKTGDGQECGACHAGAKSILPLEYRPNAGNPPLDGGRSFLHADHGGSGADCERCHGQIRRSETIWDYDPIAGTAQACETCHVASDGRPLVGVASPGRTTTVPFVVFSRFPHGKHLAPEGKVETSGKVTDGCRTCHYPEIDPAAARLFPDRRPSSEPVGRAKLVDYDACTPCHQTWKVDGHGTGAWACFKCHSGKADAQGKLAMAKATVTRDSLVGGVRFERHLHPGVSQGGAPLEDATQPGAAGAVKECRDCHIEDVPALASRLKDRTFRHDPHLPAEPRQEDCVACHASSATASWSGDLQRFDPHFEAPVTASDTGGAVRGCLSCHVGATREQLSISTATKTVTEFDHRRHVTAKTWRGGPVPCSECHVRGGDTGYTTAPDVTDCTRCHSHDEKQAEKFGRTGKRSATEAEGRNCLFCHEEVRGPVTPSQVPPRTHLSLLAGVQRHDMTGDCAVCHARDDKAYVYAERIKKAKVALSVHEDPSLAREWYNDPSIAQTPDPQGRTCRTCHRAEPRGFLRALDGR